VSIFTTTLSAGEWLEALRYDVHPPLYYLLLHGASMIGQEPIVMRFPSVFFGALMVPLIGVVGVRLFGTTAGVLAALLLVFSPFAIHHSQEARMYTLLPLLALVSWCSLLTASHKTTVSSRMPWHYAASLALAFWTHYYAALLPVSHLVYLLTQPRGRLWLTPWLRSLGWAAALSLPWVVMLVPGLPDVLALKVETEKLVPWTPLPFFLSYVQVLLFGDLFAQAELTWLALAGPLVLAVTVVLGLAIGIRRQAYSHAAWVCCSASSCRLCSPMLATCSFRNQLPASPLIHTWSALARSGIRTDAQPRCCLWSVSWVRALWPSRACPCLSHTG
jgi:uncharacterized membrane protein